MSTRKLLEEDPLLAPRRCCSRDLESNDPIHKDNTAAFYRNFLLMCVAFSFNHGSVVACLAYATTELGNSLGGFGSGTLYICYSLTAFLISKPTVSMIGPKMGLLLGVSGYCVYVGGFLFAILVPALAWPVFIAACAIGGIAGGLLWTAQGRYFSRNAKLYSDATLISVEKVNATFAGVFATAYLGLEMVTKVLATVIFLTASETASKSIVFTTYTVIAVLSCFVIASLSNLDEPGSGDFSIAAVCTGAAATGRLIYEDIRLTLLLPFQVAFGFASSFVPYYVLGTVVADSSQLGSTYVGLLSALIVFTGALTAIPAAWAANAVGKPIVMVIGGVCLSTAGFAFFVFTDSELGTWALIVPYLVLYGIGRGTWENTNKAVVADLFSDMPDLSTAAFAAISFSNGVAGSIGYFSFPELGRLWMAGIVMVASLLSIASYLASTYIDKRVRPTMLARHGLGGKFES